MKGVAYGREQAEHHPGTPPGLRDRDPHGQHRPCRFRLFLKRYYVIFLGEDEISAGVVACKDMATGEQTKLEPAATVYRIKAGLAEREKGTVIRE